MYSGSDRQELTLTGLPHSEISGSKRACRSPKLIAACYVLHRLSVPRHPPSTLSNLTIKCLDLMRSAVRHLPISMHLFIYNPYSIVNELRIAKIDAERNHRTPIVLTADTRGFSRSTAACGCSITSEGMVLFRLSNEDDAPSKMVELIGIEPTTLCLQSRCSPS
jgi:hypothetical protein